jgi:uncharacterized protein (TIGR02453 family)
MPQLHLVLDFLRQLKVHNDKTWFEAHRADYELARTHFEAFVEDVIMNFSPIEDVRGLSPKDCTFRIYRDVRFSNDKSPYKTNMAAVVGRGGRKSTRLPYYIHIDPEGSFLGGGVYMPTPEQLKRIRHQIDDDARELKKITGNKDFVKQFGGLTGERVKTAPKGYAADHPDIDLLRYKQFLAAHNLSEDDVLSPRLVSHVITVFKTLKPFNEYFNHLLGLR